MDRNETYTKREGRGVEVDKEVIDDESHTQSLRVHHRHEAYAWEGDQRHQDKVNAHYD